MVPSRNKLLVIICALLMFQPYMVLVAAKDGLSEGPLTGLEVENDLDVRG